MDIRESRKKLKRFGIICILSVLGILCWKTPAAAAEAPHAEDTSEIILPPWLHRGEASNGGIMNQNQEEKKTVSILSDSLGTYEGYTTPWSIYYYYYTSQYMSVSETWWMRYIENNDMRLGINESLGGSKVAWWEGEPSGYNAQQCMAAEERIERLDDNGTPDVILFFGGTNDIASTELGEFVPGENIGDVSDFHSAYQTALVRLMEHYPDAEIICLTPYYRDISSWSDTTDEDVDAYADCIVEICQYYGIRCVDLRLAEIDDREDMCSWDYLHVNETGSYKIWHMLQYDQPVLTSKGIHIVQNNGDEIHAEYEVAGATEETEYRWQVYDCSADVWIYASDWKKNKDFKYVPEKSGAYWLYCTARNQIGEEVSEVVGISIQIPQIIIDSIGWVYQEDEIQIGAAWSDPERLLQIRWMSYNLDTETWELISDWSQSNWSSWRPKKGNYWLHAEVKDRQGNTTSKTISFVVKRNYPVYINGTYQGPNPYGGGCLIGVSTNINPWQKYKYELLILDCSKYAAGDPNPWIYGTGSQTIASGTSFWTTWNPPHAGDYWTYFRIYDENGEIIEDQCYGARF